MTEHDIPLLFSAADATLAPTRIHDDDAGWDLRAAESVTIPAGSFLTVPTGIRAAVPAGYSLDIRSLWGLAAEHGVAVLNSPGTVETGYRGEIKVVLINHGDVAFSITRGDRIAQAMLNRLVPASWYLVADLDETDRATAGLGSIGVH